MSPSPDQLAHDETLPDAPAQSSPPLEAPAVARDMPTPYVYQPMPALMWATVALLAANVLFDGSAMLTYLFLDIPLLHDMIGGQEPSEARLILSDVIWAMIGLGSLVSYIAAIVLFCFWTHRANRNARALGAVDMAFTPGWAVGWFFIPIMNLVRPYQAFQEMWQASNPETIDQPGGWQASGSSALLGCWWLAWIVSGIFGNITTRLMWSAERPDEVLTAARLDSAACAVLAVAGLLAIAVVYGLHQRQRARAARLGVTPGSDAFA